MSAEIRQTRQPARRRWRDESRDFRPAAQLANLLLTASALAFALLAANSEAVNLSGYMMEGQPGLRSILRQFAASRQFLALPDDVFGDERLSQKYIRTDKTDEVGMPPSYDADYQRSNENGPRWSDSQQRIYADTRPLHHMDKRRLVVRVPFAQNPDTMQLSRIYKSLFTHQKEKKQPFHYQMFDFLQRK